MNVLLAARAVLLGLFCVAMSTLGVMVVDESVGTQQMSSELSAALVVGTTATAVTCGQTSAMKTWKCIDPAAGGATVYRGGDNVTTSNGFPEAADSAFGGNSRSAYLVHASGITLRCVCGK